MPAAEPAPPGDFTVLLPPGWVRIPLDGREKAAAAALATAKVSDLAEPQRNQAREHLLGMLRLAIRHAREAGGIDIMMSLAEREGIPLAASCLVSYVEQDPPVSVGRLATEFGTDGGDVTQRELAGRPAVRRRYLEGPVTRVDYHLPVPGRRGLLTMAFATPLEPLADPLVLLFDAIAESLRWRS
jgi:hypothetical protein